MSDPGTRTMVTVGGRALTLTNLDKVLYPQAGFVKAAVLDYYTRVSAAILPHLAGRPLTMKRYPDGVTGGEFFQKNAPRGTPDWVRTVVLPAPGSTKDRETIAYVVCDDLATLVWAANLAALELHVPQWQVDTDGAAQPADLLVLDLDPGPPATAVECCRVALSLRDALIADGLTALAKTSGSKGLQLYARWPADRRDWEATHRYAHDLADRLAVAQPDLVLSSMRRDLRPGKVLIDWSQNHPAKTTVAAYSLRARPRPTVSTPVGWDEVEACATSGDPAALVFGAGDVLARVAADGDRFDGLLG